MPLPGDAELRELLRRDVAPQQEFGAARSAGRLLMRTVCWFGLAVSLCLIGIGVWLFFYGEPIVMMPFTMGALFGGTMLGMPCLGYLLTGKLTAPPNPFL